LLQWFRKMAFKVDKREDRKIKIHLKFLIRKKGVKVMQGARMRRRKPRRRRGANRLVETFRGSIKQLLILYLDVYHLGAAFQL